MGVNARRKGAKNEKAAAKVIAKWTKKKFNRAPTNNFIHQRNADNSKGDIICITEGHYFPFCIELKSYDKIDFSHLLVPGIKNVQILDFWEQVINDAVRCCKAPLLMMRYNGLPKDFWFLAMPNSYYQGLPHAFKDKYIKKHLIFGDKDKDLRIVIVSSQDFFKLNYKEIKKYTKTYLKNAKR